MTKHFVAILNSFGNASYSTAEVVFKGATKQSTGHFFTAAQRADGCTLIARTKDSSVGLSASINDYSTATVPLVLEVCDNECVAAQLRELADWFEQQDTSAE